MSTQTQISDVENHARSNWRNTGKAFEKELQITCGAYNSLRKARIEKCDPPTRIFWRDDAITHRKTQQVIFLANPFLDYVGSWTEHHGRIIAIEAKSTSNHLLKFNGDNGLKAAQWANMKKWRHAKAAVALLWQFNGRVKLFTVEMLLPFEGQGAKSIPFEVGRDVPRGIGSTIWDFLPVLEEAIWPKTQIQTIALTPSLPPRA